MALSTARIHRVRGRPPLLAAGITSLIHSHSSSVRSLGYIFSFIYPFYTTREDFSDRLLDAENRLFQGFDNSPDIRASKQRYGPDYRQHLYERIPHQHSSEDTLTLTEPMNFDAFMACWRAISQEGECPARPWRRLLLHLAAALSALCFLP